MRPPAAAEQVIPRGLLDCVLFIVENILSMLKAIRAPPVNSITDAKRSYAARCQITLQICILCGIVHDIR